MQVSVMLSSFSSVLQAGSSTIGEIIDFCKQLGLAAVEPNSSPLMKPHFPTLRKALTASKLPICAYDLFADFILDDAETRRLAILQAEAELEEAATLGAPLIMLVPGTLKPGMTVETAHRWIVEGLEQCLRRAKQLDITLTIEDHGIQARILGTSTQLNAICSAVGPDLAITYDVGNFLLSGEDCISALDAIAPRLAHVHIKDWIGVHPNSTGPGRVVVGLDGRRWRGAVFGEGVVRLREAVTRLSRLGYRGYLSIEHSGPNDPFDAVRRDAEYLRELISSVS